MTDKKLSWDNEKDRLEIIKNLLNEFNSYNEGCIKINVATILTNYIPWLMHRVEQLEKERYEVLTGKRRIFRINEDMNS